MARAAHHTGRDSRRRRLVIRLRTLLLVLVVALAPQAARSDQQPQPVGRTPIDISAHRIYYYGDAATVIARGDVAVVFPDGSSATGDLLSVDLGLQRIILVGHVHLHTQAGDYAGAGLANFLQFRRVYFLPLDPSADRWTFLDGNYASPHKGRQMPGDAFGIPDLSGTHPYIISRSVSIDPVDYVKFRPATFEVGDLRTPWLPPFVYNFSPNPDFGQNALSGANFDLPFAFAGSPSSLDALHFRYDTTLRTFFSFEHHTVLPGGYLVASLNPATQLNKQWNLLGYGRLSSRSAIGLTGQLFTRQSGLASPQSSNGFLDVQLTQALRESAVRLEVAQSYEDLIGPGEHTPAPPNHPIAFGFDWFGFDQPLLRSGLTYRLESGGGAIHDAFGVTQAHPFINVTDEYVGASLFTPVYKGPLGIGFNALTHARVTALSYPNYIETDTLQLSGARTLARNLVSVLSYVVTSARTADPTATFLSPNGSTGVVPVPLSPNGLPLVGLAGSLGVPRATDRAAILTISYAPSPDLQGALNVIDDHFSPTQMPPGSGPPRYTAGATVRFRITKTLFVDVSRSYNFNWGGQRFSNYGFQVSAQ